MIPSFECSFSIKLGNKSNPSRTQDDSNPSNAGEGDSNASQTQGNANANGGSSTPPAIQHQSQEVGMCIITSSPRCSTNDNELDQNNSNGNGTETKENLVQIAPIDDTESSSGEVNGSELPLADTNVNQEVTCTQNNVSPASTGSDPTEKVIPRNATTNATLNTVPTCLNINNGISLGLSMEDFTPNGTSHVPSGEICFTKNHKRTISETDFESNEVKKVKLEHSNEPSSSGTPAVFRGHENGNDGDPDPRPRPVTLTNVSMYTRPTIESLNETSGIANGLIVGHQVHGEVVFVGERDVSGMNLSEAVVFQHGGGGVTISFALSVGPMHITLRNITREHFANLVNAETISDAELKEILDGLTVVMNAIYNQYNEETAVWTFLIGS
ncbi:unnamed protein product [Orchesella dallaii]|uniref:Uncharacterized protein n=1 Tax=Orchesella dallaii TaxID=48710 RepID=A0ABP1RWV9_9HEXA